MALGSLGGTGRGRAGGLPVSADINVTSLIDIAFVLLIIFMITAPLLQGGVDVQLPRAVARPLSAKEGLIVTVNRNGRVFVDRDGMSYEEFRAGFRAMVSRRRPSGVYLRADRDAPYGSVVRVLAVIREAGVADVGLVTEDEPRR
jgi:biopolymer transport protein ExbD/biopolymer transport protein TolR